MRLARGLGGSCFSTRKGGVDAEGPIPHRLVTSWTCRTNQIMISCKVILQSRWSVPASRWKSSHPHSNIDDWAGGSWTCHSAHLMRKPKSYLSLLYLWKGWRIRVSLGESLNLVFFLLIHSKANALLSWQVCSSSGEISPDCSWLLFVRVLKVSGI